MDIDPNELPRITSKQEAFVEGLVQGKSASDAYRAAYDCSSMAEPTVWSEASRLRSNPKVSAWLRHYQRIGMDEARLTIGEHLAELARGREMALALGQASAAVQAEHYRGKAVGLYEDRLHLSASISDADLIGRIEELFGKALAHKVANAMGVLD